MNSLYIGIGVAIIVALMTALVGPYFVDWTAYRAVFEREGQKIFGENVTVLGQAQVRLLPQPSIVLDDVVVGPVDHPNLKIDRLNLKLEMTPLMKGEIRISELRLDRPVVRMGLDATGKPILPGMYAMAPTFGGGPDVGAIGLEFAEIVDGRIFLFDERNGTQATIEALNGTASAAALAGPLQLDGGASLNGHPFAFRFATGKRGDDGKWPMRLQANPVEAPYQLNIEAMLDTSVKSPKADGSMTLQRLLVNDGKSDKFTTSAMPWQIDSKFAAETSAVLFNGLLVSIGPTESASTLSGKGRIDIGATSKIDIELSAKQIDLDRLIAQKVDEPADPQLAFARIEEMLVGLPRLPLAGRLHLGVGGVVLGGGAAQDVDLDARTRADGWAIDAFSARLPGRSRVLVSGRLVIGQASGAGIPGAPRSPTLQGPTFQGQVSLASDQPVGLSQWWQKGPVPTLDPFSFSGRVTTAAGSLKVDELSAKIGTASAKGALQWSGATDDRGERLKATLSADQLDLDQVRVIAGLANSRFAPGANSPASDLPGIDLDLDAGAVLVAGQQLKGVTARLAFDGTSLTIDRLAIRDAMGAAFDVHGRIDKLATTPDGVLDGSIQAERLGGLAHFLETMNGLSGGSGPLGSGTTKTVSGWVKQLVAAAPALGPFSAKAKLTGEAGAETSNVHLTLDGTAAGSRLGLEARFDGRLDRFRDGALDASLQLVGPDGGLVLRQIGIPALSDGISTGKLTVSAKGTPASELAITVNADVAGSKLTGTGHARVDDTGTVAYDAEARVATVDLRLPATMFGQALPTGGATVPLDVRGRINGTGLKAKLTTVAAKLGDTGVVGAGDVDLSQWPIRLDGSIQATQADMQTLVELGIGADAFLTPVPKGGIWPSDVLAGPVFSRLNGNIDFKADRLSIDQSRRVDRLTMKLRLRPGQVLFDGVSGRFAGGDLTGALGIKTGDAGEIALTGNLQIKRARLTEVVWRRDDRAVADGTMDLTATFDASGRSIAALASNINGAGALTAADGLLRYTDPSAFGAVILAADGGLEIRDDKIRSVFQSRLDAGTLPFQRIEAAFSLQSGVLRANTVNVISPNALTSGSVALDFGRWAMDADWTLKVDPGKNGVVGAEPQVGVLFRGPIDAPKRTLDVAPLSAFLTLRAFEREVQRVEDLQQDIMERDRFQRELKRLKADRARREQEQKAAELATKQQADEAKKADDARKAQETLKAQEAARALDAAKAQGPGGQSSPPAGTNAAPADGDGTPSVVSPTRLPQPPPAAPAAPTTPLPTTTQSVQTRPPVATSGNPLPPIPQPLPKVLPELPPVIFINPKPPVTPLVLPNAQ